jgi:hypothetical protein
MIFFVFALTLSADFRLQADYVDGRRDRSAFELEVGAGYRFPERHRLELQYQRLSRSFGDSKRTDDLFTSFATYAFPRVWYVTAGAETCAHSDFSPLWGLSLDPHAVLPGEIDLGFQVRFRRYRDLNTWSLRPTVFWPAAERLSLLLRADIAIEPKAAVSLEGGGVVRFEPVRIRLTAGGGKADEGEGLIDSFWQFSPSLSGSLSSKLQLFIRSQFYRGDIRRENRVGGGFEWTF